MALSAATVFQGQNIFIADVTAAADGDTGELLINHGLGIAPLVVIVTPLLAITAAVNPGVSVTTKSATQVGVTKALGGAGSAGGGATPFARVMALRPHSSLE